MSTLFDQALHIYGDIVAPEIMNKLKNFFKKKYLEILMLIPE